MLSSFEWYLQAIYSLAESGEEPANQISRLMERNEEREGDDGRERRWRRCNRSEGLGVCFFVNEKGENLRGDRRWVVRTFQAPPAARFPSDLELVHFLMPVIGSLTQHCCWVIIIMIKRVRPYVSIWCLAQGLLGSALMVFRHWCHLPNFLSWTTSQLSSLETELPLPQYKKKKNNNNNNDTKNNNNNIVHTDLSELDPS